MKFTHVTHINGDEYEIIADNTRDDGEDHGYYGYAYRDGERSIQHGLVGPHPTPQEATHRMIQRVIRDRGDDIP